MLIIQDLLKLNQVQLNYFNLYLQSNCINVHIKRYK